MASWTMDHGGPAERLTIYMYTACIGLCVFLEFRSFKLSNQIRCRQLGRSRPGLFFAVERARWTDSSSASTCYQIWFIQGNCSKVGSGDESIYHDQNVDGCGLWQCLDQKVVVTVAKSTNNKGTSGKPRHQQTTATTPTNGNSNSNSSNFADIRRSFLACRRCGVSSSRRSRSRGHSCGSRRRSRGSGSGSGIRKS